jgi:hypothetical protein
LRDPMRLAAIQKLMGLPVTSPATGVQPPHGVEENTTTAFRCDPLWALVVIWLALLMTVLWSGALVWLVGFLVLIFVS